MTALLIMTSRPASAEAFFGFGKKQSSKTSIEQAEKYYQNHEYYQARRMIQQILEEQPENLEAQNLMGKILDAEVERQKKQLTPQAVEEMNSSEKDIQIKTWLERSRALFQRREYDLALFAAEKVFLYDANNLEASKLIDDIKAQALKEGKADVLFLNKMYEEEISERLEKYRDQAQAFAAKGYFGRAKFMAEKILLLEPEDKEAQRLYQTIIDQEEAQRHET